MITEEKLQQAINTFGSQIVNKVISIVEMTDPDMAYVLFEDDGLMDETMCVEMLYFEE